MNRLYHPIFTTMQEGEKESLIRDLVETLPHKLIFHRMERFSAFGQTTITAVFNFEGKEFVFVPGNKDLILGWDSFSYGMDLSTKEDLEELFDEYEIESSVEDFIRTYTSPVRKAEVAPLLVERIPCEIGWKNISLEEAIAKNGGVTVELEQVASGKMKEYQRITGNNILRFIYGNNGVEASSYEELSYNEFLASLQKEGFDLATEDEWEYLCGGGSRSLWRWGDSIDYSMNFHHFGNNKQEYDLDKPNCFGLKIAFDPYKYEVINDTKYLLKAGDGGCNICGGGGIAFGYLPTATYYRDPNVEADNQEFLESIGGEYTTARRIIRFK